MKYQIERLFTYFLFAFMLPLSSQAVDRESPNCQIPIMYSHPIYSEKIWDGKFINQKIKSIQKTQQLSEDKAKGALGEECARRVIQNQQITAHPFNSFPYISIFTLFHGWGCDIIPFFRNASDNGIDDVFIVPAKNQWNEAYPPIFHEAKYKADGQLKLNKNKRSCDQLSITWTGDHLDTAQNKIFKLARVCFQPTETTVTIKMLDCNPCYTKINSCIKWLNYQFNQRNFYRTASVLDKNGKIKFHLAQETHYEDAYTDSTTDQSLYTDYTEGEETINFQTLTISDSEEEYSRFNLYQFLNYLPREETYKDIAKACSDNGYPIRVGTLQNLTQDENHAPSKDYFELWEALKRAYPEDYKYFEEWLNS